MAILLAASDERVSIDTCSITIIDFAGMAIPVDAIALQVLCMLCKPGRATGFGGSRDIDLNHGAAHAVGGKSRLPERRHPARCAAALNPPA
jgi:hypothetical protein